VTPTQIFYFAIGAAFGMMIAGLIFFGLVLGGGRHE